MKRLSQVALPLVAITLMVACTPNPRIQSDYNDDLNFGAYETFNFAEYAEMEAGGLAGDVELYFSAAIMERLQERGLTKAEDPDLLINVLVDLVDISRPPHKDSRICPRYEDYYSKKFNLSYGGFTGEARRPMCIYAEGQIEVQLIDVAKNQAIMEAVSRVRIDENDRGANLQLSIRRDVATMFGDPPVRTYY